MITLSAIKFCDKDNNMYIFLGKRHADILKEMYNSNIDYIKESMVQGFWCQDSVSLTEFFLDRYEAKKYAIKCGQIEDSEYAELYSEDLWSPEIGENI